MQYYNRSFVVCSTASAVPWACRRHGAGNYFPVGGVKAEHRTMYCSQITCFTRYTFTVILPARQCTVGCDKPALLCQPLLPTVLTRRLTVARPYLEQLHLNYSHNTLSQHQYQLPAATCRVCSADSLATSSPASVQGSAPASTSTMSDIT